MTNTIQIEIEELMEDINFYIELSKKRNLTKEEEQAWQRCEDRLIQLS